MTLARPNDSLPVDEWDGHDGDDTVLLEQHALHFTEADAVRAAQLAAHAVGLPPKVPLVRDLKYGVSGEDVEGVKRALSRAGHMEWGDFTRYAGVYFTQAVKSFQRARRLRVDGVYGDVTHEKLRTSRRKGHADEWAFDQTAVLLMKKAALAPVSPEAAKREAIADAARYWIAHRDQTDYAQVRPMRFRDPPGIPPVMDCSWYVTACYHAAHCADPNRLGYNGQGFTGTLWIHGEPVALQHTEVGDLVFYGVPWMVGGRAHVAVVIDVEGGVRYVGSDGSDSGPLKLPADYRPVTGCRSYL